MSISFFNMFIFIFKSISYRINYILITSIILTMILFELFIVCNLIPFWSNPGLLVGLDDYYNPITDYYSNNGLFSYTKSLCFMNLNQSVVWLALHIPYKTNFDCYSLIHFNEILHTGINIIPYFWVLLIFWCFATFSLFITFITCITLFKFKSKIFYFIGMIFFMSTIISTIILLILFFVSMYMLFIKYIQDSPIFYINFCFILLHSFEFIGLITILLHTIIRANKYRTRNIEYDAIH